MKRRLLTLGAVATLGALILWIGRSRHVGDAAESTFALGFALLAAALFGEIVEHLNLPRITGYIFAGILFGPHVGGFLSVEVLGELTIFNDMAYAFIGLAAGAELKLATLRGRWKSIVLLIAGTSMVVMIGVGSSFFAAVLYNGGFLGLTEPLHLLAVAGLIGVIASARSPSSAIAIIDETKAEGPFTETILGVSVAMDVVVICLFSVAVALCGLAFSPAQGIDLGFVLMLSGEILTSIVSGIALGAGIGLYLKHRGPQLPLVIVGLCFVVYRFSEVLGDYVQTEHGVSVHLEPLLICAAAGFVIQNFSPHGRRLLRAMEGVSLPVYVIFFAMAGARLNLGAFFDTWEIALLLAGCRVAMIVIGTRLATKLAGDEPLHRKNAWLGFVTQAGLSLALIAQIEEAFPGWGTQLATILMAVVAINQLVGPAAFKIALERVGESGRNARNGRSAT
ncbi:MAG: hypothetical protein GY906_38805 [bacterium]|nr:hypothetical protein [bacterium]